MQISTKADRSLDLMVSGLHHC